MLRLENQAIQNDMRGIQLYGNRNVLIICCSLQGNSLAESMFNQCIIKFIMTNVIICLITFNHCMESSMSGQNISEQSRQNSSSDDWYSHDDKRPNNSDKLIHCKYFPLFIHDILDSCVSIQWISRNVFMV
jgi:hypothetical protein